MKTLLGPTPRWTIIINSKTLDYRQKIQKIFTFKHDVFSSYVLIMISQTVHDMTNVFNGMSL